MSNSQRPHGQQPTRLLRPWNSPGKNTGVGYHCLLCKLGLVVHKSYASTGEVSEESTGWEVLAKYEADYRMVCPGAQEISEIYQSDMIHLVEY